MKIHNKKELENIATNNSEDVDYKDFMNINKKNVQVNHILFWLLILHYLLANL